MDATDSQRTDSLLDELLADAILVASFGQRSGRFDDNSLFAAIRAAKARKDLDWASQETVDLQDALNKAVRKIQPVTLFDLKNDWNPFRKQDEKTRTGKVALAFICAAALLIIACGYYTVWYKRAGSLLESIAEAKEEKQTAVVHDILAAMIGPHGRFDLSAATDPGDITHQSIREKIDLVRQIDKKIAVDMGNYYDAKLTFIPITPIYYSVQSWASSAVKLVGVAQAGETFSPGGPVWKPAGCYDGRSVAEARPASAAVELQDPAARSWRLAAAFQNYVTSDDRMVAQLRCAMGIFGGMANPDDVTSDIRNKMDVLGSWLLPALYGALGALMFHMRAFLDPLQPDPIWARVLLRVSLGSFAGIAVAWFLTPSVTEAMGVGGLGLGVLTLAFLLGFSIDVFFALLDRLVTMAKDGSSKIGGSGPAPRASVR